MRKLRFVALAVAVLAVAGTGVGQDPAKKEGKAKGILPPFWKDIVSEDQKQKIYEIQAKYKKEIEELRAKLKDLEAKQNKEMFALLSPEQKKSLEDKIKEKAGMPKEKEKEKSKEK
jgi:hypothetical protein